ncbi:Insulin-degrading enzyme-like 1, peroxisomal, partial [Dichanthelium oligosanthes]
LPNHNIFIPSDLSLKSVEEKVSFPSMLRKTAFSRLWYKPDTMFFTPKAYIKMDFHCPLSQSSPESAVLTDVFTSDDPPNLLLLAAYDAQVAGLYYIVKPNDTGFQVTMVGFNDKMRTLLETVIGKIAEFEVKVDRFSVIKAVIFQAGTVFLSTSYELIKAFPFCHQEAMIKEHENFKFRQPYQQVLYYCSLILDDQAWPWDEEFSALSHLEPSDLGNFLPHLMAKTFIECYFAGLSSALLSFLLIAKISISGNIEPNEAKSVIKHVEDVLFNAPISACKPLSPSQHLAKRIVKLEKGLRYYYPAMCLNNQDENSALLHYIQACLLYLFLSENTFNTQCNAISIFSSLQTHQDNVKQNVLLQLLALVGKQPAFHQLRSVEQLGYIALLRQRNDSGVRGLQFIIQSTVKDPANLDARVENFLKMFEDTLYQMSDAEFKSNVSALIDMKLEKYKNIREESAFFWGEISEGTLKFDRKEVEVAALRELKKEELIDFFNDHVKVNAPQKKVLSIQVYGGLHAAEYQTIVQNAPPPQSCEITDICSFRRSRPLYGSFRGAVGQMKL